jgi:hypothetical protein
MLGSYSMTVEDAEGTVLAKARQDSQDTEAQKARLCLLNPCIARF